MDYAMEDNQNSAPGTVSPAQAAKLGGVRRPNDAQSTTKRFVLSHSSHDIYNC